MKNNPVPRTRYGTVKTAQQLQRTRLVDVVGGDEPANDGAVATSDWPMPAPRAFDEAFFARVDEAVLRDKQADGWNVRNDERAMRDQVKLQGMGL
jgi:hypothetical protein